jgi:hypothetical protein
MTEKPPDSPKDPQLECQKTGAQGEKIDPCAQAKPPELIELQTARVEAEPQKRQEKAQGEQQIHRQGQGGMHPAKGTAQIVDRPQQDPQGHRSAQEHELLGQSTDHRNSLWRKPSLVARSS